MDEIAAIFLTYIDIKEDDATIKDDEYELTEENF
jgi:hypothetical protein